MEDHTLRVLEFEKVIAKLQDQSACAIGREVAGLSYPTTDLETAKRKQQETAEARAILQYEGNIPLGGIEDIRAYVERADIQALLQPQELLSIHGTLLAAKRLHQFLVKVKGSYPLLGELAGEIGVFDELEADIAGAISQGGEVMDSASHTLARVRSELRTSPHRTSTRWLSIAQPVAFRPASRASV